MRKVKFVSSLLFTGVLVCGINGCAPRGESHTVEEILSDARKGYLSVFVARSGNYKDQLTSLARSLDKLAGLGGGGDAKAVSGGIADALQGLIEHAGFTVRPAMTELINQYRVVANSSARDISIGAPNLKLLVARTYTLVASELKTTQFKIA